MPSRAPWARAATALVVVLLASGPLATTTSETVGSSHGPRPAAASADDVDAATAPGPAVVEELRSRHDAAAATQGELADAHAALVLAEDDLDAAEADAAADADEPAVDGIAHEVEPPATELLQVIGAAGPGSSPLADGPAEAEDDRPEVPEAVREARAAAHDARAEVDDAEVALDAAEEAVAGFVDALQERFVADLGEADTLVRADPAAATALREEVASVAGAVPPVVAAQEERVAARTALASAPAEPADEPPSEDAAPAAAPAPQPKPAPAPPPPPPLPDPTGSASGVLAAIGCANGDRIVVDGSIGGNVQALVNDAAAAGIGLCGGGFRTYAEQVELRRAHCGQSDHAVFQAPPSSCSPPTARPGTSNHEDGLAVDFSCADGQPMTHASPCYQWLAANAGRYHLFNLPSEPWHWSVTGR
jgi:D-alanyl-D-alanine carboxypeptidase